MALTNVETVRLLIGLGLNSPFYDMMSDEELEWFITYNGNSIIQAARMAAIALSMQLAGVNTREITGDIHVYNEVSSAYLRALANFIKDSNATNLPNGLMPYASGISWEDFKANNNNPDNIRSPLTKIRVCDERGLFYANPFNVPSCGC